MHSKGSDEQKAHTPQEPSSWNNICSEISQRLSIFVNLQWAFVEVKVADHVCDDKAEQNDAAYRHGPFFSYCTLINVQRKRKLLLLFTNRIGPFSYCCLRHCVCASWHVLFRFSYIDRTARQDLWANCVTLFTSQKSSLLSPQQKRWNYCFLMPEQNFDPTHRWFDLCYRSHIRINEAVSMCNKLIDAYNEPHRHYHTMNHVYSCLNLLDGLPVTGRNQRQT